MLKKRCKYSLFNNKIVPLQHIFLIWKKKSINIMVLRKDF